MTTRRDALLALSLLSAGFPARAQAPKAGKPKRIGFLSLDPDPKTPPAERPFYIAMRKRGWILGDNLVREAIYADGKYEDLSRFAEELVRKRVDVILCGGDIATVTVARATRTIPIVFFNVAFPVELGLVESYARPGRNVTGRSYYGGPEIAVKRLGFLKEIVPNAKRLSFLAGGPQPFETVAGVRFDPSRTFAAATKALGFETRFHPWPRLQDVDIVLSEVAAWRAQAVTAGVGWIYEPEARKRVAEFLLQHRLPSAFLFREVVEAGGLMSYGVGQSEAAYATERLAEYVDQVLRGRAPADLPVEQPRQHELVINMKTAKALGLTIPQSILPRADQVIE